MYFFLGKRNGSFFGFLCINLSTIKINHFRLWMLHTVNLQMLLDAHLKNSILKLDFFFFIFTYLIVLILILQVQIFIFCRMFDLKVQQLDSPSSWLIHQNCDLYGILFFCLFGKSLLLIIHIFIVLELNMVYILSKF